MRHGRRRAISNCLYNFNVAHNSLSLNLAEVALEKKPAADSRAGFRVDLDYGPTATLVHAAEPGGTTTYQNIQQAYVSVLAGKALQLDFGKFVTWSGQELIESKDNWNYSRGLLFSWAIPYYHTGLRAAYAVNDKVSLTGFLVNGWNNAEDNNTGKTARRPGDPQADGEPRDHRELHRRTGAERRQRRLAPPLRHHRHLHHQRARSASPPTTTTPRTRCSARRCSGRGLPPSPSSRPVTGSRSAPRYEYFDDEDGFSTGTAQSCGKRP